VRKGIVSFLAIVAFIVYGWNIWYFVRPHWASSNVASENDDQVALILYSIPEPFRFAPVARSPFEASLPVVRAPRPRPRVIAAPVVTVTPPRITINGIMWNADRPLAMLGLPNGSTKMVKVGDELLGRIVVKAIERNRVQVLYKEQLFWIDK